jgi:hypothetical protein
MTLQELPWNLAAICIYWIFMNVLAPDSGLARVLHHHGQQ